MKLHTETKTYESKQEYLLEQAEAFKEMVKLTDSNLYITELSKFSDKQQTEIWIDIIRFLSTHFCYETDDKVSIVNEKELTKELSRIFKVYNKRHGLISEYAFFTCVAKHTFAMNMLKSMNREDLVDADSYSFYKKNSDETIH